MSGSSKQLSDRKYERLSERMNSLKTKKQNDGKKGNQHRFRTQKEKIDRIGSILPSGGRLPFSEKRSFIDELDFTRYNVDTSPAFFRFWKDVRLHCLSFHLLVHNRKRIVDTIIKHIQIEHNVALKTILNLTIKLAALLGSEFNESFPPLFDALVSSIHPPYVEETAVIFRTLGYLFKFLSPYLIKQKLAILDRFYGPLLGHRKAYLRTFAAELISSIYRKMELKKAASHLKRLFAAVSKTSAIHNHDLRMGLSTLLFFVVRNAQSKFHSRMLHLFPTIYRLFDEDKVANLDQQSNSDGDADQHQQKMFELVKVRSEVCFHACLKMIRHTNRASAEPFLDSLHAEIQRSLRRDVDQAESENNEVSVTKAYTARLLLILAEAIRFRRGTLAGKNERKRLVGLFKLLFQDKSAGQRTAFAMQELGSVFRDACTRLFKVCWIIYLSDDPKSGQRNFREPNFDGGRDASGDDGRLSRLLQKCLKTSLFHQNLGPRHAARVLRIMGA